MPDTIVNLNPPEIVNLASAALPLALQLHEKLETAMNLASRHHETRQNKPFNAGPLSIALGSAATIKEQLEKHVRENSPAPVAAPATK